MLSGFETIFFVIFLSFTVGLGAGYLGGYLRWSALRALALGLECRVEELEGRMTREVKIRATEKHRDKKEIDAEIIAMAAKAKDQGAGNTLTLDDWRKKAFTRSN